MGDSVKNKLEEIIGELTEEERKEMLIKLQELIANEYNNKNKEQKEMEYCPKCGSISLWKAGKYKTNQRYKCKDCFYQFTENSNLIFSTTKLSLSKWLKYSECMIDKLSLRASASKVKVGLKTSFFMRHRILECIKKHIDKFRVNKGNGAELDECFVRENFKGNHNKSQKFKMPRKSRKRGNADSSKGSTGDLICILTGINDNQDVLLSVVCRGYILHEYINKFLDKRIEEGAIINTDGHIQYKKAFIKKNITHNRYIATDRSKGVINNVNALHSRFKGFLHNFHGVSTRRLENYISWFMWFESYKKIDSHEDKVNLLYSN